ncbi:MAG: YbhB/YbcL family Raf kinase inhibitor-like protein [Xanthobacteraceae bacterium]
MSAGRRFRPVAALGGAALVLVELFGASSASAFSASFAWCPNDSPNFQLSEVPAETVNLQFAMTDLDQPSFHHGGGTVGYRGQPEVPCGAFASGFVGPAPPPGEIHTYEFTIRALAPNGTVLATTTARKTFPE